jgi:hypothetical protein
MGNCKYAINDSNRGCQFFTLLDLSFDPLSCDYRQQVCLHGDGKQPNGKECPLAAYRDLVEEQAIRAAKTGTT